MKTSNKILLIAGIAAAAALIASVAVIRVIVHQGVELDGSGSVQRIEKSGEYTSTTCELDGFEAVQFIGGWEATVRKGERYAVSVRFPENYRSHLDVRSDGNTLKLGLSPRIDMNGTPLKAEIVMPRLEEVHSLGGIDLKLRGFSGNRLLIKSDGGANIHGEGGPYERLALELRGGANVDLLKLPARNVRVEASGAANIGVAMRGGDLTGSISGAGSVKYTGEVRSQSITTGGVTSVRRLE